MKKYFLIFPILIGILNGFDSQACCNGNCDDQKNKYVATNKKSVCNDCKNECNNDCDCKNKNDNYKKYWVQYSENNSLFFRYLTTSLNEKCPSILVDEKKTQTFEREHTSIDKFPLKICQVEIDNYTNHNIKFKDLNVSTKVSNFDKISVIGDTGCITWDGKLEQKCNVLSEYPFPEIARKIAKSDSDLVIHVGDYYYSKSKCTKTQECYGRPYGDKLDTWKVDFLDNAEVFFKNKPISFSRGNHEKCGRGGNGWAVIFDYSKDFRECSTYSRPYSIEFDKFRLLIVDSAEAEDSLNKFKKIDKNERRNQINSYIDQFNELAKFVKNDKENILVIHRPVLSREIRPWDKEIKKHDINYVLNYAIQHSEFKKVFSQIKMILSGHTHSAMFFDLQNKDYHLYQIVSGNSGAFLNNTKMAGEVKKIFNYKIKDRDQYTGFGFSELFLKDDRIEKVQFYDYEGNEKIEKKIN